MDLWILIKSKLGSRSGLDKVKGLSIASYRHLALFSTLTTMTISMEICRMQQIPFASCHFDPVMFDSSHSLQGSWMHQPDVSSQRRPIALPKIMKISEV